MDRRWGFQEVETARFGYNRHIKVVTFWALRTRLLYPQGNIPGTHCCQRLSRPQRHSAAGRIMSMKNFNDIIRNRTRDLPACSAVPQPTAPPHTNSKARTPTNKEPRCWHSPTAPSTHGCEEVLQHDRSVLAVTWSGPLFLPDILLG